MDFLDTLAGIGPESPIGDSEGQIESLRAGMDRLTPKQRFVIERAWGITDGVEYSYREIAALMGISHVAVSKLYHAAMRKLERVNS